MTDKHITKEEAENLIEYWGEDLIVSRYEEFRLMTTPQKEATVKSMTDAQLVVGRPRTVWLEKALVWDIWERLRSNYIQAGENELSR